MAAPPRTQARIGLTSTFHIGNDADPIVYTKVGEVTNIKPPGYTRQQTDATHLESPDGFMEYINGLKDSSEASIGINWVPSATDVLLAAFDAEAGNFKIVTPNAIEIVFGGVITGYEPGEITPEGKLTATLTIKPSGRAAMVAAP